MDLLRVVSHHRARLATPLRTVQKVYGDADLENVPFADTIFGRSTAHTNRPYLLIEPSYRISSDDKSKASNRSTRTNGDKEDAKAGPTPTPAQTDNKATSNSSTNTKTSEMPTSEPQTQNLVSDGSAPNTSEILQSKNETTRNAGKEKGVDSKDIAPEKAMSKKSPVTLPEMGGGKTDIPLTTLQAKQDGEKHVASLSIARPPLEENIILGVALEGSKRTLPIEEEMAPSSIESKEFTASRNGGGSPLGTDGKD